MKNALTFSGGDYFREPADSPQGFGVRQSSAAFKCAGPYQSAGGPAHSKTQARKGLVVKPFCLFCPKLCHSMAKFTRLFLGHHLRFFKTF
jgi:hypothetical protein